MTHILDFEGAAASSGHASSKPKKSFSIVASLENFVGVWRGMLVRQSIHAARGTTSHICVPLNRCNSSDVFLFAVHLKIVAALKSFVGVWRGMLVRQSMRVAMIVRNLAFALTATQMIVLCIQSVDGAKESNLIPVYHILSGN